MKKNKDPLISIITVVYNGVETLEYTLKSIAQQTYSNIEFIIVDGDSKDGTLEIIQNYSKIVNILVSEKDKGIYDAMNKGLKLANGDWVLFLGADDLLAYPQVIAELTSYFTDYQSIYYGNSYIKTVNRLYNGKISKWSLALGNVSHQAIFYPKHIYKKKFYDETYRIFADHIYNIELYSSYASNFIYLPKLVSIYSGIGISSNTKDEKYEQTLISVIKNHFGYICGVYVLLRRKIYRTLNYYRK